MKKTLAFLLAAAALLLCGCGAQTLRDDLDSAEVADAVGEVIPGLTGMSESYLKGAMKLDTDMFASYSVRINASGTSIDEYGVFKARSPEEVNDVIKAAEDYLQLRRDTWMPEYMPEERPKLDCASVRAFGLYAVYVIAFDDVRDAAFSAAEAALKK
ncbi:MAG: DUF4358 domain-containing protein [Oscillospiraceae bacterium]|jgi:hypothetical protein|nr:DUF4358 domain-containing protein [Oscillospiraceae bacterium]